LSSGKALRALLPIAALAFLLLPALAGASSRRESEIQQIERFRQTTWHWQTVMGVRRAPSDFSERRTNDAAYRHWVWRLWRDRANRIERLASNPPHKRQWLCIHRGEGPWKANTGNGYYGGLQMDLTFQRSYGPYLLRTKGTANRWTPYEQMWVAERAYRSGRGFYPWPNTARACGLI
jgi:hypothetical protein